MTRPVARSAATARLAAAVGIPQHGRILEADISPDGGTALVRLTPRECVEVARAVGLGRQAAARFTQVSIEAAAPDGTTRTIPWDDPQ